MPDRPGALGQVASRIGAVRGDVLAIEILEHGAGRAIDELMVSLPDENLISLLTAEVDAVDGVSVESIRVVDEDRTDPSLAALALCAAVAESPSAERVRVLVAGVERIVEADWVAVLQGGELVEQVGEPPDLGWLGRSWRAANTSTRPTTPRRATRLGAPRRVGVDAGRRPGRPSDPRARAGASVARRPARGRV